MKRFAAYAGLLAVAVLVFGCAPGVNSAASAGPQVAGFWQGLWQGFILLFTFVISLFNHSVGVYEIHNSGGWYNFGYLLGVVLFWGGGARGSAGPRRRRERDRRVEQASTPQQ
jgi:hypothetical protein